MLETFPYCIFMGFDVIATQSEHRNQNEKHQNNWLFLGSYLTIESHFFVNYFNNDWKIRDWLVVLH